jgi:hypothetical protein
LVEGCGPKFVVVDHRPLVELGWEGCRFLAFKNNAGFPVVGAVLNVFRGGNWEFWICCSVVSRGLC